MKQLENTDNKLVGIAIGRENGKYYVQTTDIHDDDSVNLSEHIQEGLECKEHAIAIASLYIAKYDFDFYDWTK